MNVNTLPTHRRMFCVAVLAIARGTGAGALAAQSAGRMALASAVALSWSSSRRLATADNVFGNATSPCNNDYDPPLDEEGVAFCEAYLAVGCDSNPENDQAVCDAMDAVWHNVTESDVGPPTSSSSSRALVRREGGGGVGRELHYYNWHLLQEALDCCPDEVYGHRWWCQGFCVAIALCELTSGSTHCLGSIVSLWLHNLYCDDLPLPSGCGGFGCTCENGGTCNLDDSCSCPDGFIGTSCQVDQGALQTGMGADQLIEQPNSPNRYLAVYTNDTAGEISVNIAETLSAVTWMVVAGGGAGFVGGGGAGGLLQTLNQTASTVTLTGSISVQVGRGGMYIDDLTNQTALDQFNGMESFLRSPANTIDVTAMGGGSGTGPSLNMVDPEINGGSGGGSGGVSRPDGGNGTMGQGNDGGDFPTGFFAAFAYGSGGGGAGAPGENSNTITVTPGAGGVGRDMSPFVGTGFGDNGSFAGGGGGYRQDNSVGAIGGAGGGGDGLSSGAPNTGGGGGGQGHDGGSGIVFIGFELP